MTIGGERGAESEVVETGRWSTLEECCRGRVVCRLSLP